ncbi:MAG: VPLPA-CTERM sorting domain-containing protein [Pseudomonadota bacterium]
MKKRFLALAFCLLAAPAQAATLDFSFSGELGVNNLSFNQPFGNGTFSGTFSIDTDIIDSVTSSRVLYRLTAFDAEVTGPGGESRSFNGPNRTDGPLLDEADSFLAVFRQDTLSSAQGFELSLFEVYDGSDVSDTRPSDRRFLRLQFDAESTVDLLSSVDDLIAADPLFGAPSRFDGGSFQLGLSTVSTGVTSAQVSVVADDITPVPLPAAGFMLLAGLAGLTFAGRRRRS